MASGGGGGVSAFGDEREMKKAKIEFDQTELRLGLPGDVNSGKRGGGGGFNETDADANGDDEIISESSDVVAVDLKLNLASSMETDEVAIKAAAAKPPTAKAQVVGWPPVRSFRKNTLSAAQKMTSAVEESGEKSGGGATYVKVSMDGAPYLRKVDLKMYKTYQDLCDALAKMFCSFTIGNYGSEGMKDFMNCSKLVDLLNGSEYVPTYEDKDGDWMLVGDVPWGMFTESCKRMRIMKGKEAVGLAPRAMEKCKNRT